MTQLSIRMVYTVSCACFILTSSLFAESITPDMQQGKEKEKNVPVKAVVPDKKENLSEIANAEQNAIQETNRQFDRMQQYGTPVEEYGPIPMDYKTDDNVLQKKQ